MTYQETLNHLYGLNRGGIRLGLENCSRVLDKLGNPQLKTLTIHIAGTNGKGSTAAFLQSILSTAGYRAGLYTSPHLIDFRERIRINDEWIGKTDFVRLVSQVKTAASQLGIPLSFFEFGTIVAFLYFFEKNNDINIIEVGLGGRLDATNVCQAEISILTSIALDHTEYLGSSPEQIAREKALIVKDNGTVFAQLEDDAVFDIVRQIAQEKSAKLFRLGTDFQVVPKSGNTRFQTIDFLKGSRKIRDLKLGLIGKHQASNAALAISAALELKRSGLEISDQTIRKGLETTRLEGRLEVTGIRPSIILDCAHNPHSVRSLTQSVRELFSYKNCYLILGIMKDKPVREMLKIFIHFADHIILVKPQSERSEDPRKLKLELEPKHKNVEISQSVYHALQQAKQKAGPEDLICVSGSIFTVAEAKQALLPECRVAPHIDSSESFNIRR